MPQPMHLTAVQQNALTLRANGDLAGARLMLEQALEVAKASLGEDHPDVLSAAHVLASMHREAGEPTAARRVLEEAVAAGQLRFGDGEPVMLALSYTLGIVADELGNRHEARRSLGRVAAAGPAVLGQEHAWVREARAYLGGEAAGSPPPPIQPIEPIQAIPPVEHVDPLPPQSVQAFPPVQPQPIHQPTPQPPSFQPPIEQIAQYPPPPHASPTTSAPPYTAFPASAPPARRGRGATVAASIAAAAAVLAAAITGVVLLRDHRESGTPPAGQATPPAQSPTVNALPPERVRLTDDGDAVTLSWADPTGGTSPFIVSGGRKGDQPRIMGQVAQGSTKYRLDGLSSKVDYCFMVVAVYSAEQLIPSEQVCTHRASASARPSTTPKSARPSARSKPASPKATPTSASPTVIRKSVQAF